MDEGLSTQSHSVRARYWGGGAPLPASRLHLEKHEKINLLTVPWLCATAGMLYDFKLLIRNIPMGITLRIAFPRLLQRLHRWENAA